MVLGHPQADVLQARVAPELLGAQAGVGLHAEILAVGQRPLLGQEADVVEVDLAVVVGDRGQLQALPGALVQSRAGGDEAAVVAGALAVAGRVGIDALDGVGHHAREDVDQLGELEVLRLERALAQGAVEGRRQDRGIHRLLQVVGGSVLHRGHGALDQRVAGHEHDHRVGAQLARRSQHASTRGGALEDDVAHHRVEAAAAELRDGGVGLGVQGDAKALALEDETEGLDRAPLIVDQQDVGPLRVHDPPERLRSSGGNGPEVKPPQQHARRSAADGSGRFASLALDPPISRPPEIAFPGMGR